MSRRARNHRNGARNATPIKPPEEPVPILPPEDELELVESHPLVHELVFRRELVLLERLLPLLLGHRRQRADDRLPFDDGKARVREAVTPPTTTIAKTSAQQQKSHAATRMLRAESRRSATPMPSMVGEEASDRIRSILP
jgi:hypothetical protein